MASKVEGDPISETDVKELVEKMFLPGYRFPQQDTDDCLKVEIRDLVSFGDIKDASIEKPQNSVVDGTIIGFICTVRHFIPGNYKVTVIKPYLKEFPTADYINNKFPVPDYINDPLVIFHHEKIDPSLLVLQVIRLCKDYCEFHKDFHNSINRYDWCHWNHFMSYSDLPSCNYVKATDHITSILSKDPEKYVQATVPLPDLFPSDWRALIYFTKTEKAKQLDACILKNQVRRSSVIKNLFSVQDDDGDTISIGVNFTPFNTGEWEYAKAFQDTDTDSYFALILNGYLSLDVGPWKDMYTNKEKADLGFTTLRKTGLKFPMRDFLLKDI